MDIMSESSKVLYCSPQATVTVALTISRFGQLEMEGTKPQSRTVGLGRRWAT
jgi:hypothetical protein